MRQQQALRQRRRRRRRARRRDRRGPDAARRARLVRRGAQPRAAVYRALGARRCRSSRQATARGASLARGEKSLAHIHLAQLGLPPLDDEQAFRLFLADRLIASGHDPRALGKALGFDLPPGLKKYSPDQPRDERGRWTSDGGGSWLSYADETGSTSADRNILFVSADDPKKEQDKDDPLYEERRALAGCGCIPIRRHPSSLRQSLAPWAWLRMMYLSAMVRTKCSPMLSTASSGTRVRCCSLMYLQLLPDLLSALRPAISPGSTRRRFPTRSRGLSWPVRRHRDCEPQCSDGHSSRFG